MFWNSILAGLKVLTYWETYVVGLEYLAIIIVPTILWNITTEKFKNTGQMGMGCLGIFLMPLVQMAATSILVLTLAPIIFGEAESAAWNLPCIQGLTAKFRPIINLDTLWQPTLKA